MQPVATIHHRTASPPAINNTLTVAVAADAAATQRALDHLDLTDQAIRAMRALGLTDQVRLTPFGLRWRPDRDGGQIGVRIDARVEPALEGSSLTIITRFSATDERTHERLLDAWPLVNPLARELVKRASRTVKEYAEADRFEEGETISQPARAA